MTKYSQVSRDFGGFVVARLRGPLVIGAAALMAVTALAAPHPIRYAEAHETVAHRAHARHVAAQTAADSGSSKSSKAKPKAGKKSKAGASTPPAKSSAKSKRRRTRPQEADNDPLVINRVGARRGKLRRDIPRRAIASRWIENEPKRAVEPRRSFGEIAAAKKMAAAEDADDTTAEAASAASESTGATDKPSTADVVSTLKLDSVSAKNTLPEHGRVKASPLPEDHAGKVAVIEGAMQPMVVPVLYTRRGRLIVPPPLKGSRDILVHQNTMADSEGLDRIQDDDDLDRMRELHLLVPLNDSAALYVNEELPENRRYARPWAARFATDMSRAFYARFHQPLRLSSAVRTVEYQLRLQRVNGNAAAVEGDGASPHLTGQALDFGKHGMSMTEIAWMRAYLKPLMQVGKVDVEEEFQQSCFHISVYRNYVPKTKVEVARAEGPVRALKGEAER